MPPFLSLFQAEQLPEALEADDYQRLAQRLSQAQDGTAPAEVSAIAPSPAPAWLT